MSGEAVETAVETDVAIEVHANYRGTARFDRLKLLRVVQNMARNGCDAILQLDKETRDGRFSFVIDEENDGLVMTFSDNGVGVPVEFRHRMFEAFETQGKKDGTGLGLAMVKQFATAHGGSVAYMEKDGGGATFEIRIRKVTRGKKPTITPET